MQRNGEKREMEIVKDFSYQSSSLKGTPTYDVKSS